MSSTGAADTIRIYEFGDFRLDPPKQLLTRRGEHVQVSPKAFKLLVLLVENRHRVVSKSELMEKVWEDAFVEEGNLKVTVSALRKALGDSSAESHLIETVPKFGYRFREPVHVVAAQEPDPDPPLPEAETPEAAADAGIPETPATRNDSWRKYLSLSALGLLAVVAAVLLYQFGVAKRNSTARSGVTSIAVLPFANLTGQPDQDYFTEGITDELITALAQIRTLNVISRTSVNQYKSTRKPAKEIARELNIDAVVEGSALRSGNRVRITAQLVQAREDRHLWAESYERDLTDILKLQNELAHAIAREVQASLTPQEKARLQSSPSINPDAHEEYLKGCFNMNRLSADGLKKGLEYYNQALAIDPQYSLAYSGVAHCYLRMADWGVLPAHEAISKARAAAEKALSIDDSLAEVHTSLGAILFLYDWKWAAAENEFIRSLELNPGLVNTRLIYSNFLVVMGRQEEAFSQVARARQLDPLSQATNSAIAQVLYFTGRYDEAIEQFKKTLELYPEAETIHLGLSTSYQQKGMFDQAADEFLKSKTYEGLRPETITALRQEYARAGIKGLWQMEIQTAASRLKTQYVHPFNFALCYANLENRDMTIQWLERAFEERYLDIVYLNVEPRFQFLRDDPRFRNLLARVGVPGR
jgi:TolB-like protein/DNA-binding winged helix-turn-helix (wHTH) protein/Tfp pilus assembly protein PilF